MNRTWIVACTLLFVSIAGFADGPAPAPVSDETLAAILGESLAGSSCATQVASMNRASVVLTEKTCSATVTCLDGSTRTCSSASTDCVAVNPNCSTTLEPGHVTCSGVTTNCPSCCTGGTAQQNACCRCNIQGDCMNCCRCDGGTLAQCRNECNPF
ncbi:MAG TPA: hypothetical protein VLT87_29510 [Thermoanaerobaculia bacterium]|nr:hypothetical protein [Thermoanaerobaculia bacterium]